MFIFRFMRGMECKGIRGGWRPLPPNPQKTAKNEFKLLPTRFITLTQLSIPTHIKSLEVYCGSHTRPQSTVSKIFGVWGPKNPANGDGASWVGMWGSTRKS